MENKNSFILVCAIAMIFLIAFICCAEHCSELTKEIEKKDSLISVQADQILIMTYQHEDDDALMEEEYPDTTEYDEGADN